MTQRELQKILIGWRDRLGLGYWEIDIDFQKEADEGADGTSTLAAIEAHEDYDTASIKLSPNWEAWTPLRANQILAHELIHAQMRGLDYVVSKFGRENLGANEREMFDAAYSHEMEGAVDRIAQRFVTLLGIV